MFKHSQHRGMAPREGGAIGAATRSNGFTPRIRSSGGSQTRNYAICFSDGSVARSSARSRKVKAVGAPRAREAGGDKPIGSSQRGWRRKMADVPRNSLAANRNGPLTIRVSGHGRGRTLTWKSQHQNETMILRELERSRDPLVGNDLDVPSAVPGAQVEPGRWVCDGKSTGRVGVHLPTRGCRCGCGRCNRGRRTCGLGSGRRRSGTYTGTAATPDGQQYGEPAGDHNQQTHHREFGA